jgi:microcin C transport system substrate-binding protein
MRVAVKRASLVTALAFAAVASGPRGAAAAHAVAQFGPPKYPAAFSHFDYVNPEAPKGGTLTLSDTSLNSSFDKLNPFTLKGKPAPGLMELVFETLTIYSLDEPNTQYGLLADDIDVAPDFGAVTFHINPRARFSNGDPVTARDVKYSFTVLTGKKASPRFKSYFSDVAELTIVDPLTVRFRFKRTGRDLSFIAGSLPVFSARWGERIEDGRTVRPAFDELRSEPPISSGPYVIESATSGQDVTYRRNPGYWGHDIPVRRGTYNFERVAYKLYKDVDTRVAALRAGDFDYFSEVQMRYWCCQYIGHRFDSHELIKEVIPHKNPPSMNGWVLNLRRDRFRDPRVRQALNYAVDFEWINDKIFMSEFKRVDSYFSGTPLAATGLPSAAELALLEPYRAELDPAVFGPMFVQPTTNPPGSVRKSLTRALALFAEAGWHNVDGVLRNAKGEPFTIELSGTRKQSPFMDPIYLNLTKLGVVLTKRLTDTVVGRKRMTDFDFDWVSVSLREARMPGAELWRTFNSQDADVPGSENVAGVKSRVVDELINKLLDANSQEELEVTAHALDRVLIHSHYFIPWRYLTNHYLIYNKRLKRPQTLPLYYGANEWTIATWWDGSLATGGAPAPTVTTR